MTTKYDEDFYDNPFFTRINAHFSDLVSKATSSKGVICVPKYDFASKSELTDEDAGDHILLPTTEVADDSEDYITVSGKIVQIADSKIITKAGFSKTREISVLFSETFHTDDGQSYRVLCIDGFLNRILDIVPSQIKNKKPLSPASYKQCLDLLWSHSGGQRTRDSLDKLLNAYAYVYDRLEGETLRSIVDAANSHFTKAMQLLLKDTFVRRSARHNESYMENLKLAVETYLMNAIHKHLFRVITATVGVQDAEINKITRNLVDLQLTDLGIRKIFSQNIPPAKKELMVLNKYSTPMGRLFCIKRVVTALTKPLKKTENQKESTAMMTTDDLLPILIFLIIKSEIPNWMANLVYMRHFHFAKSSEDDEYGFYLASVEAALEHIRSGNIKNEISQFAHKRERWNNTLGGDLLEGPSSHTKQAVQSTVIDDFFRFVQEGEEKEVRQLLEKPHKNSEETHLKLCHPLCSCDKCDKLLSKLRNDSSLVTAYTRDSRGYTALHIAAYYGQGLLIDVLIKNHAVVDATDYLGLTPLHLACQRGYQNVMLLLLHFGSDVMARDNEGYTALHLCCANGHEDCVKALVFYDASLRKLQINATNELGDTPLHLASKWGFETIVRTLLENGADPSMVNRKRQTPVDLSQNAKVQTALQNVADGLIAQPVYVPVIISQRTRSRTSSSSSLNSSQTRKLSLKPDLYDSDVNSSRIETALLEISSDTEKRRKREKLFKAIIEGDIQLVKFYLGIESEVMYDDEDENNEVFTPATPVVDAGGMCHPLCQCEKCLDIQKNCRKKGRRLNANIRTSTGHTPIHMAVLHNHSDIVALLLSLDIDVSAQNHKCLTALHLACCMKNSLITDMLVKAGARLEVHDINGDTPLIISASNSFINGLQILVKAKSNLNAVNSKGNTAIHESVKRDLKDVVELLLIAGADPRLKNKDGRRPVQLTEDISIQGLLMAASFKMSEAEKRSAQEKSSEDRKANGTLNLSIKELFAAFEENDLNTLQVLTASIRSFDRKGTLKKTFTRDCSSPSLTSLSQAHHITKFDKSMLRKVHSVDKTDPLYVYSLFKSDAVDKADAEVEAMIPLGENTDSLNFINTDQRPFSNDQDKTNTSSSQTSDTKSLFVENSITNSPVSQQED